MEKACCAFDEKTGDMVLIACTGETIEVESGEDHEELLNLLLESAGDPPDHGIWIWEGKFVWERGPFENESEGETVAEGDWRLPNQHEVAKIMAHEELWKHVSDYSNPIDTTEHETVEKVEL